MKAYEMAKKYYPRLWDKARIENLYKAGKLTEDEYKAVLSEVSE